MNDFLEALGIESSGPQEFTSTHGDNGVIFPCFLIVREDGDHLKFTLTAPDEDTRQVLKSYLEALAGGEAS